MPPEGARVNRALELLARLYRKRAPESNGILTSLAANVNPLPADPEARKPSSILFLFIFFSICFSHLHVRSDRFDKRETVSRIFIAFTRHVDVNL